MKRQRRDDIVARADDAYKNSSYAEYSVAKAIEGKYKQQRFLMILLYIGVAIGVVGLLVGISQLFPGLGMIALFSVALGPLAVWMMVFFTWHKVSIEYKYVIDHSEIVFSTVYGGKSEKEMLRCKVKDFELIAPLNDEYKGQLEAFNADITVEAYPSLSSYDISFALKTDENNKKTAVIFQVTNYTLKAFKYYNKDALVMTETMR